ncbi:MAG: outer membrane beta-barrel protein [Bacteroidetes bacterium]|nr:outer membrane beta-barrel protein [Bacteroidota bacterium]
MKRSTKTLFRTGIVCAGLLLATSVHAQFSVGLKAGVNLATEQYPGFTMQNALLGYGGASVRYKVGIIALQVEGVYSGEGGNLKAMPGGQVNKYRESYLDVPVLLQSRFPFGGYLEFGVQQGFLLSSTYNFNSTGVVNTRNAYTSGNFSVGGGFGFEFQNSYAEGLGINIRFMQGTTAISSSGYGPIKTSMVSLGLSERF